MNQELGIVIPLQEKSDLSEFLTDIALVLIRNSINSTVTIVASDSIFHLNADEYESLRKKYLLNLNCITSVSGRTGYGRLIRLGIANTQATYIAVLLPNQAMNAYQIPDLLSRCRSGADLVIVNRFSPSSKEYSSAFSKNLQRLFRVLTRISIGIRMPEDSTFAYRMFNKSLYEYIAVSGNSWDMLAEQTVKTLLSKSKVESLDSRSEHNPTSGIKFSYLRNIWSYSRVISRGILHRMKVPWF
jgi:hypothetical protein